MGGGDGLVSYDSYQLCKSEDYTHHINSPGS